ncbi:MAG: amino acid permease [Raineya sp.]|nr:amino acid permease [Raineya sp.]
MSQSSPSQTQVSFLTAVSIVVANMIGSGVFTSLGFQAIDIKSVFPLLLLWIVGGIIALCGAFNYGELAARMPRSGGEYHYLSQIYHRGFGFLSGWVSATVGFAAPIALAAMALGEYASDAIFASKNEYPIFHKIIAVAVILTITFIHATDIRKGSFFQQYSTALKLLLIIIFILAGLIITPNPQAISVLPQASDWNYIWQPAFAVSLAYVSFAYSGWNASAYLAGEIENPRKNVPKSLFLGTMIVMIAYVLLNFIFLYTTPIEQLAGKLDVGYESAKMIFGSIGGKIMASMIALLLISSISAMIFAGPRVTKAIGEDFEIFKQIASTNSKGIPTKAIFLQSGIAIMLVITSSFEDVLYAIAFVLEIFTISTVLGVFVLRFKERESFLAYKAWGYPITTIIFIAGTAWTMIFLFQERILPSLKAIVGINLNPEKTYISQIMPAILAVGTLCIGLIVFLISDKINQKIKETKKV